MSVKLIVKSKKKGVFKLKNHKQDEGVAIMRRQTWQEKEDGNGWRKNEYKLVKQEKFFKQETDGTYTVSECSSLQDFPVLVHYFQKKEKDDSKKKY